MFDPVTRTFSPDDPILLQLKALVALGSFTAAYTVLSDFLLSVDPNTGQPFISDPTIHQVQLFFQGAALINANLGEFNESIRVYNDAQNIFRNFATFSPAEQEDASNAIADAVFGFIINQEKLPTIDELAGLDAPAAGVVLFPDLLLSQPLNPAWSGVPLFPFLASDQSFRLENPDTSTELFNFAAFAFGTTLMNAQFNLVEFTTQDWEVVGGLLDFWAEKSGIVAQDFFDFSALPDIPLGEGEIDIEVLADFSALAAAVDHMKVGLGTTITGDPGDIAEFLIGGNQSETLLGGGGSDLLFAAGGNDILDGQDGDDVLHAGAGDDILIGSAGSDLLFGGDGFDTADYSGFSGPIERNFENGTVTDSFGDIDTLDSIEFVMDTAFGDKLVGGPGSDIIVADLGNDTLIGGEGDDDLDGGADDDTLEPGTGNDIVSGGDGIDTLFVNVTRPEDQGGVITVTANALEIGTYIDLDAGFTGELAFFRGDPRGFDTFDTPLEDIAMPRPKTLESLINYDILAKDPVTGLTDIENIHLVVGPDPDFFASEHFLVGNDADNVFVIDALPGSEAIVHIVGGGGADTFIISGPALVFLYDVDENDTLILGDGQTEFVISGGIYDTELSPFRYFDDNFQYQFRDNPDELLISPHSGFQAPFVTIPNFDVGELGLDLEDFVFTGSFDPFEEPSTAEGYTIRRTGNDIERGTPQEGPGNIATPDADLLVGTSGSDNLDGGAGDDLVIGFAGNDTLAGGTGNDTLRGGDGDDTLVMASGAGDDVADGGAGTDTATFASAALGVQVDLAAGTAFGVETGTDTLISIENVIGGAGNDTIVGAADANKLSGGPGNDTLTGGLGDDLVDGGDGDDIAVFAGAFADYSFAQDVGTVTVVGADGTDILQGIETLRFDDKDVLVQDLPTASSD